LRAMNPGRVSLSDTMPYVDCANRIERFVACMSEGMNDVESSNGTFEVRVSVSTEKIPACVGTRPKVTRTTASDPQKTGQCLIY
jgi:hypothetical protein